MEKANEKSAINDFISQHPELEDEAKWNEVVSNYNPKHGKDTTESIKRDLERAYFLTRFERGEMPPTKSEAGEKAKTQVAELASVSKTTAKSVKDGKAVSNSAIRLAERMRVDLKKLAEEDDSLTAEIKL